MIYPSHIYNLYPCLLAKIALFAGHFRKTANFGEVKSTIYKAYWKSASKDEIWTDLAEPGRRDNKDHLLYDIKQNAGVPGAKPDEISTVLVKLTEILGENK